MCKKRKLMDAAILLAICGALIVTPAFAFGDSVMGGWVEGSGIWSAELVSRAGNPQHGGEKISEVHNGTTRERAHGWTTWVGKYHYTRARMEHDSIFCSGVITDSGRVWGTNGTEAYSPWVYFRPDACCACGGARTYYGA